MPSFESDAKRLSLVKKLGQAVTYTPSGGVLVSGLYAIIDRDAEVFDVSEQKVIGSQIEAQMRTIDLTGTVKGGTIVDSETSTSYTIEEHLPDGIGWSKLTLTEA